MEWMEVVDVINGKTENFENCVYLWRNKVNGKLYVGIAKDFRRRTKKHKYVSFNKKSKDYDLPLHRSIRKRGIENFEICILEKDLNDCAEMGEKEDFYIKKFDTLKKNKKGYNIADGGGNGNPLAGKTEDEMEEFKRKQSKAQKGKKLSEETKQKLSEANKGENHPQCRKIICMTNGEIFDYIKQASEKYGVSNKHISDCCLGKRKSTGIIDGKPATWMYLEDYEKLSKEEIAKIKNEEVPNGSRPKAVICVTTGKIYKSAHEASRQTGVTDSSGIIACCKGKRKSVGVINGKPAIWLYYSDYEKLSEEEINKIKNQEVPNGGRPKAVICLNTGIIYGSTNEVERQTGVDHRSISACCRGKLKSAGKDENGNKLTWKYLDEYLESK